MSNVEGDDNDVDGDLIFISEEHIDLEDSTQSKHDQREETREEETNAEIEGADTSNTVGDAEEEHMDDAEEEEQEPEEQEGEEQEGDEQEGDEQEGDEQEGEGQEEEEKLEKSVGKDGLMVVDEWDDDDLESEPEDEVTERDEDALNPEDIERSLLNMPALNSVLNDIGHLKQNRRVVIHPLTVEELESPKLKEIIANDACEEIKVSFVRSKSNPKEYTGIVVLNFMTCGSASQALEEAKQIKEDITVKLETNTNTITEQFIKDNKTDKRWTDNVLVVRNLIDDVKLESLKELFPDAEEVVIHKEASKRRESTIARGYAFLLFRTDTQAATAAKEYEGKKLMLDGHRLAVLPYRQPEDNLPRGLLRLRERKLVFRHLEKLNRNLDKAKDNSFIKVPKCAKERIDRCNTVIDRDNKARRKVNLAAPTLEEMKKMDGLPILTPADCRRFLIRLGIIDEKKEPGKEAESRPSNKRERSKSPMRRNSDRSNQRSRQRGSSPRNFRRSPPRKRNWIQNNQRNQQRSSASSGNMMRNTAAMGAGMINPLALMMQQQMMGPGAMLNPGMMIPQNIGPAAILGAGGLMGNVPQPNLPFLGQMAPPPNVHGMEEPGARLLRLDEAGNFRSTDDRRFHERDHRRNEGQRGRGERDDRAFRGGDMRQERHHRSRSPDNRSARNPQRGDMRSYGESPPPGGDPRDMGGARLGEEGESTSPANLLYNLSKMLSQKLEQKRQEVERERRGYDRGEYHGGPR